MVTSSQKTPFTLLRLICLSLYDTSNTFHSSNLDALDNISWSRACFLWESSVVYFLSLWHFLRVPKEGSLRWLPPHRRMELIQYFLLLVPLSFFILVVTDNNNLHLLSHHPEYFTPLISFNSTNSPVRLMFGSLLHIRNPSWTAGQWVTRWDLNSGSLAPKAVLFSAVPGSPALPPDPPGGATPPGCRLPLFLRTGVQHHLGGYMVSPHSYLPPFHIEAKEWTLNVSSLQCWFPTAHIFYCC